MFQDFLLPFITVALAELGDKTQVAVLCLSAKTKKHLELFLGIALAFLLTNIISVFLGAIASRLIPVNIIKIIAGLMFILFGLLTLLEKSGDDDSCSLKAPFVSGFSLIFFSELGDKTQLSVATFSARLDYIPVFIASYIALLAIAALSIYLGSRFLTKIDKKKMKIASGALFIILGILSFIL